MANNNKISDELLAAYLDGNTNEAETQQVLQAVKDDEVLRETLEIALCVGDDNQSSKENPTFEPRVLPMMKLAAESGKQICSVMCEAYILLRRGVTFEETDLLTMAQENHWLKPEGAPLHSIGQILSNFDLLVTRQYDATIEDISKALNYDNDVIVVVDCDKLYPEHEDLEDEPNHAIVVIDVEADAIRIFDPKENALLNIESAMFQNAWKESDNYMVRVLQTIEDYDPQPINLEDINLTDELLELREAIAENAHDVWAKARMNEGWSYGTERDDDKKKHPDLVPYSALPDSEKEYDRIMALDSIRLVKKLGFDIVKK